MGGLLKVMATALAIVLAQPAGAEFNGNDIAPECERNSELCLSWVAGLFAMHGLMAGLKRQPLYCRPNGVIASQAIQIYQAYLRDNPSKLHMPADAIFVLAMQERFPCRR